MSREVISTSSAPAAIGAYSQAIAAEGRFLFCSGQIPLHPDGQRIDGDIKEQARQCMENISAILSAAGLSFESIVKTTIYLSSMEHFAAVNEVYGSYFSAAHPARSTVAVAGLPRGAEVEIDVIAVY